MADREAEPAHDALGRRIVSAPELAELTPEERSQLHQDRAVVDPAVLPDDVRRRFLGDDDVILERV